MDMGSHIAGGISMCPKYWEPEEDEASEKTTHFEIDVANSEVMAELKEWLERQAEPTQDEAPHDPSEGNDSVATTWNCG